MCHWCLRFWGQSNLREKASRKKTADPKKRCAYKTADADILIATQTNHSGCDGLVRHLIDQDEGAGDADIVV